jgi:GT2 family glycosyltransferase
MSKLEQIAEEVQRLVNAEEHDKAKELLTSAREDAALSFAERSAVNHLLGRIFYYEEDFRQARKYFLESLADDPANRYSRVYLGLICEKSGDANTALKLFAETLSDESPFVYLRDRMADLLKRMKWNDVAVEQVMRPAPKETQTEQLPKFSIIILGYNKAEYTRRCLESVFANTDYPNYEVIVVDNAAVDETAGMLETFGRRIRFVHSRTNLGFIGGNNLATQYAEGEYLLFLNNDTEVQRGWITELYNCYVRDPRVGAVGSMLVYPNNVLQEAGGVIFNDATGWNYGKNQNVHSSLFRFVREVDYCSGAALSIKKEIFEKLGGYDLRFAPAYFEDTDLCFAVRKLGYKVMYCPTSRVIHYEGVTNGTDVTKGMKRYQIINAPKFKQKWAKELSRQYPPDANLRYWFSNRAAGKRVLIIDDLPPLPDRAAGSLRMYHTVQQMLALGFQITYVHLSGLNLNDTAIKHMDEMRLRGVEFIWFEYERWWNVRDSPIAEPYLQRLIQSLELPLRKFACAYICFWHIAGYFLDLIREADPNLPIVVDSMDLHYVREMREAEIRHDASLRAKALHTKKRELEVYAKADCVTTVTESDRAILRKELPGKPVMIMTDVHDPVVLRSTFETRNDFLFIGNFNHNPNEDAVLFFVQSIFPHIKKELPDVKFWIVGNNPGERVRALASDDIIVTGWVPEVRPYLEKCRVAVAPLRFGAGNKGKVGESLSYGVPVVTTSIGAEGMNLVHGEHAFIADEPKEFARYAVQLYREKELWMEFAERGRALIASQYSSDLMRKRIEHLCSFPTRRAFTSYRAVRFPTPPKVSIIILTHNQYSYTRQCLESIRQHTTVSHETIVIDNASTDGTPRKIEQAFPEVRLLSNAVNVGFPAGVNQGISASLGEYIVLLNNDTVVTESWLERMIEVAESDPAVGIVGPMSNAVSGVQRDPSAVYKTMEEMHAYARALSREHKAEVFAFPRVAFLCTLIKRSVLDTIGGLDERFSPGNFEDDDFCLRSTIAGFRTVIAKDVFIHHFGSKSFLANGVAHYTKRLEINGRIFAEKWGVDHETLWTQGKEVKKRSLRIPLSRDPFIQYFERAQILLEEREMQLALESLEQALDAYHSSQRKDIVIEYSLLLDLTGNVALTLGEWEKARRYFEEELTLTPNSSSACTGLGEVFFLAGLERASKTMFEHAVCNDEGNLLARRGLAKVNRLLGLPEDDNALLGKPQAKAVEGEPIVTPTPVEC